MSDTNQSNPADATPERLRELLEGQHRLIASVAHELRTPLSAVVGLSSELRDHASTMAPEELRELAAIVAEQSTVISAIVEDLLAIARMRGEGLTVSSQEVDLVKETQAALTGLKSPGRVLVDGAGRGIGDPLRVRQVLRNLLSNALSYGGLHVAVHISESVLHSRVEVTDDGPGLHPDRVDRVFDAFERSHDDPGRPGSMGLGLTVGRGLARLMGGDLVYRRKDDMTTFDFTLPSAAPVPSGGVRELVYQSRANTAMGVPQLEELLSVSRRNNRAADLTGLLLYHEGDFLQVLEGPTGQIDKVFNVIKQDSRHYRVNVIVDREIPGRSFGEWEMGFYEIEDPLDSAEGVSAFLNGAALPTAVDRYVHMLFEAFRDRR